MSKIELLNEKHDLMVKTYIHSHFFECIELAKIYDKNGIKPKLNDKNSGSFLGFLNDDEKLEGLFVFTNNKRLLFHYTNKDVTRKVDLLKAIKHYKPAYMSAPRHLIEPIWRMFERTVKRYKYNNSMYMIREEISQFNTVNSVEEAKASDAMTHMGFFVELEKHFQRNHMTINQIQKRIKEREGQNSYIVIKEKSQMVAQGFIEDEIGAFSQIGGLYTSGHYRKKGYGNQIVKALVNTILSKGHLPILAVLSENLTAVNVYKSLGFEEKIAFGIYELEF